MPALALVGLVIRVLLMGGYVGPAGQGPENRSHARTDEEELVKRFILNNADKYADKVKFLTWGPHMEEKELQELTQETSEGQLSLIVLGRVDMKLLEDVPALREVGFSRTSKEPIRAIIRVRYEGPAGIAVSRGGLSFLQSLQDGTLNPHRLDEARAYDDLYIACTKRVFRLRGGVEGDWGSAGDDWKQKLRKELSKRFPAIKP